MRMYTDCKWGDVKQKRILHYFNSRMYTDCKVIARLSYWPVRYNFNSRMYTDCKGHGINPRPYPAPCFPFASLM